MQEMQEFMAILRDRVKRESARDSQLRAALRRIENGTATFKDTALWSERASTILGEVYGRAVPGIPLETRRELTESLLREQYETANEILASVQRALDASQGLHLAPQKAEYPAERVAQLATSLTDQTVPDETIQRRARAGTANISKAFHDSYMQENAKFRSSAGLKCYITRDGGAKCCPWCAEMVGRYVYGDEPHDVYRRHDNCSCTVIFENGRERHNVWSKQTWEVPDKDAGAPEPTVFTDETRPQGFVPTVLTPSAKSGRISVGAVFTRAMQPNRRIGSEGQQIIDQPTYNKLVRDFLRRGGVIRTDEEATEHLRSLHVHAAYLPSLDAILFSSEPTVSEVLEETYHAEQDRQHMFGDELTEEVYLRREIDAQQYLLSMTERYKIPDSEVEETKANLADYERRLARLLQEQGGEPNE